MVAVVGALFAFGSFLEARRQANIAQKTLIQANRAWMTVRINADNSTLRWFKGAGPGFVFNITTKNIGNSPSIDVRVGAYLYFAFEDPKKYIQGMLGKPCDATIKAYGSVVFPTEDLEKSFGSAMFSEIYSKLEPSFAKALHGPNGTSNVPLIGVVCVSYQIVGDEATHHTIRSFRILTKDKNDQGSLTYMHDVKTGDMVLSRQPNGDYTD